MTEPRPHFFNQLHMKDVPTRDGDFAIELMLEEYITNPRGGLQGGLVATLVDIVAARAVLADLPVGQQVTTADMTLHFLSGITMGPARAEATVRRRGKRTAVVSVDVYDAGRDVLAAVSTVTFAVLSVRPGQAEPSRQPDQRAHRTGSDD